MIEKGHQAKAR